MIIIVAVIGDGYDNDNDAGDDDSHNKKYWQ
jgi:hypothetical protein